MMMMMVVMMMLVMMVVVVMLLLVVTMSRRNLRLSLTPSLEMPSFLAGVGSRNQHHVFPTLWQD